MGKPVNRMTAMKKHKKTPGQSGIGRGGKRQPTQADYEALSEFRYLIRCFLEFSQNAARAAGLAPRQHQALLAIRGYPGGGLIAVGDLAERLRVKHHSAVELIDRLAAAGLVKRVVDPADQRRVLLKLTSRAEKYLAELSAAHLGELSRIEPLLMQIFSRQPKEPGVHAGDPLRRRVGQRPRRTG
jgi:DNA-binding MarR family transcriptional regulator